MAASLAFDPIAEAASPTCRPATADSFQSTTLRSPSQSPTEVEDAMSRSSSLSSEQLPPLLPDLSKISGVWLGQGSILGDVYTIEAVGASWSCQRSGLRGPRSFDISWDADQGRMVLGGRYTLDPTALLQDSSCLIWSRIPGKGKMPAEVVWKRRQQKATPTVPSKESTTRDSAGESKGVAKTVHPWTKRVYSRAFMLTARCDAATKTNGDVPVRQAVGITVKDASDIQFVCPAGKVAGAHGKPSKGNTNQKKGSKTRQQPAAAADAGHKIQQASATDLAANATDMVLKWLTDKPTPAQMERQEQKAKDFDPCGLGVEHSEKSLAEALAKLLSKTPASTASSLRATAPEFVPSSGPGLAAGSTLRVEAPEFLPPAARALSEAAELALKAVGKKAKR